jgi:GT2 family glycosyltransferase
VKNAVLVFAYNNIELTRAAIESVLEQTIPVHLTVVDNGSTDDTISMLEEFRRDNPHGFDFIRNTFNVSPTHVANGELRKIFRVPYPHVLMLANDLVVPPNFYEELLKWPRGIVCGAEIKDRQLYDDYLLNQAPYAAISENTPMSALLLRRWVYDAVLARDGYFFDERYFHYASDCDLALRVASCGIWGIQLNVPYFHHSSATINNSSPEIASAMHGQANVDRAAFVEKWGFPVTSLEYGAKARDINFRGEGR